jgi:ABC-2 type transport system permease protein
VITAMRSILVLVRKDFTNFRRNKSALSLTFIVPFALIYLFGFIFGLNRQDRGPSSIPLAVVNASDLPAAAKLVEALKAEKNFRVVTLFHRPDKSTRPLTEADLRPIMQAPNAPYNFALVIPADVVSQTRFGISLKILSNPRNEIETQTVNGLLQKAIFNNVPQLLGQSLQVGAKNYLGEEKFHQFNRGIASAVSTAFGGDQTQIQQSIEAGDFFMTEAPPKTAPSDPTLRRLDGAPGPPSANADAGAGGLLARIVKLDTEQVVGTKVKSPAATRIVGGWAMQFLLFALSASAASLFRERDAGLFQRLLAAPLTRAHLLWSKFLYGVALGLFQLVILFCAGRLLYGIEVEKHLPLLIVACTFAAAACTSFGMLIAAISPNSETASGISTFAILIMSALGGAWFPLSLMPEFIQQLGRLTLVYWSMEGFTAVLWANRSLGQILPILGVLAGMTIGTMAIAIWRFNRSRIFD